MENQLTLNDFLARYQNTGILIDVRSPEEFRQGHIPGARNIPLFSDEERKEIGTLYTCVSKETAFDRGLEIVGPKLPVMVREIRALSKEAPVGIYCWRGGLRSESITLLLQMAGISAVRLQGGYKAYRRGFEELLATQPWRFVLIGGMTGCGKTELLHALRKRGEQILDLECLASHKGSVFGHLGQPSQPTNETFINDIHVVLQRFNPSRIVWIEAESATIGTLSLPECLYKMMQRAPVVFYEIPKAERLQRLVREYGNFSPKDLTVAFEKIRKRLGDVATNDAVQSIEKGDMKRAAELALYYYDKSYRKSLHELYKAPVLPFFMTQDDPDLNAEKLLKLIEDL